MTKMSRAARIEALSNNGSPKTEPSKTALLPFAQFVVVDDKTIVSGPLYTYADTEEAILAARAAGHDAFGYREDQLPVGVTA